MAPILRTNVNCLWCKDHFIIIFVLTNYQINFMRKISVAATLLITLFSCSKEKSTNSGCAKTVASIAGTYSVLKAEIGLGGVFVDITSQLDVCKLDDRISLNTNGTTVYADLGTVCSPSGNSTGTWSIDASGRMTIDDGGGSVDISTADITSFDCTTLVLTGTDPGAPGESFRLTMKK